MIWHMERPLLAAIRWVSNFFGVFCPFRLFCVFFLLFLFRGYVIGFVFVHSIV